MKIDLASHSHAQVHTPSNSHITVDPSTHSVTFINCTFNVPITIPVGVTVTLTNCTSSDWSSLLDERRLLDVTEAIMKTGLPDDPDLF